MPEEMTESAKDFKASIGAIHYHASRPALDKDGMYIQLLSIVAECEKCIPDLTRLRPLMPMPGRQTRMVKIGTYRFAVTVAIICGFYLGFWLKGILS